MSRVRASFPAPTKNPRRFILNNFLLCTFSFGNAYNKATIDINNRRYSQVVRQRSAKPSSPGSNPGDASKIAPCRNLRHRSFFIRFFAFRPPRLFALCKKQLYGIKRNPDYLPVPSLKVRMIRMILLYPRKNLFFTYLVTAWISFQKWCPHYGQYSNNQPWVTVWSDMWQYGQRPIKCAIIYVIIMIL